jgi:hypothetical protein
MRHQFNIIVELTDQDYLDIFTTACEGGIDYWFSCTRYHWGSEASNGDWTPDLVGFCASGVDVDDHRIKYLINKDTIIKGLKCVEERSNAGSHQAICKALAEHELGNIDAGDADTIVQYGLFGEVRFG